MTTEALTIEERIRKLAEWRVDLEVSESELEQAEKYFELAIIQTPEYLAMMRAQKVRDDYKVLVDGVYSSVKDEILADHQATGKKQYPGAQVKLFKVRRYDDSDALEWCVQQKYTNALKLDRKQFEKLADVVQPPWVEFDTEPRVQIDKDLSQFLEQDEHAE